MSELELPRDERLALRARAHHLNPVVLLGAAGLTDAVLKETDRALTAHELIKVRVPGEDREAREAICAQLAERLGAARVQIIGKLLVLYRPRPDDEAAAPTAAPGRGAKRSSSARSPTRPSHAKPIAGRKNARSSRAIARRGGARGR
jgi:putative YhbY family RNA-binding protein